MIDLAAAEREIVQAILRRHVPDRAVVVFGSRAHGTAKPFSDLDLAILGETPLSLSTLTELADAFTESDLRFKVDIVDWASTSEPFRKIIEQSAVPIQ